MTPKEIAELEHHMRYAVKGGFESGHATSENMLKLIAHIERQGKIIAELQEGANDLLNDTAKAKRVSKSPHDASVYIDGRNSAVNCLLAIIAKHTPASSTLDDIAKPTNHNLELKRRNMEAQERLGASRVYGADHITHPGKMVCETCGGKRWPVFGGARSEDSRNKSGADHPIYCDCPTEDK